MKPQFIGLEYQRQPIGRDIRVHLGHTRCGQILLASFSLLESFSWRSTSFFRQQKPGRRS